MSKSAKTYTTRKLAIVIIMLALIGFGVWFVAASNSSNELYKNETNSTNQAENKPDVSSIKPLKELDYKDRAQVDFLNGGEYVKKPGGYSGRYELGEIDAENCSPGIDKVYFAYGHTVFAIEGKKENMCEFWYGTEVENPLWDGLLDTHCMVPARKYSNLSSGGWGPDFSILDQYCLKVTQ